MITPRKLIETALPLDDINREAAREKSIRHGHPSTLHLWWARRPLAAARAVIFAQMVNDPGWNLKADSSSQQRSGATQRRNYLFDLIRQLVVWENSNNPELLRKVRKEIKDSWKETCELNKNHPEAATLFNPEVLPAFHDPFAGGGAIPLEAQRLGLESHASDLNPVAVTINKAMIEIPPRFAGRSPVNPEGRSNPNLKSWQGAQGLADDVRYYGNWMRDEAQKRIGHLYPQVEITPEIAADRPELQPRIGEKLTVIAWLWARTVKSPNPAYSQIDVPLASTFILSSKAGKEAYVEPVVNGASYEFRVKIGKPPASAKEGTKLGRGANFKCIVSEAAVSGDYIKAEGKAGRLGAKLMAVVAEGVRGRIYLAPTQAMEDLAKSAKPSWRPVGEVPAKLTGGTCVPYGLREWGDLFTPRQLVALNTFSDLVVEARDKIAAEAAKADAKSVNDPRALADGGTGAKAYAEAVSVYLAFAIDRLAMTGNSLVRWNSTGEKAQHCFGRQALPMLWDFAEPNFLAEATGSLKSAIFYSYDPLPHLPAVVVGMPEVLQSDAQTQTISLNKVISTDPPYYDNIGYADLSDFFYVWMRRNLREVFPQIYGTLAVPKAEELVATPYRHGGREAAANFFLTGMTAAMASLAKQAHPAFPISIYYAFKASETDSDDDEESTGTTTNTGWETFLQAVMDADLAIDGTWPMRTEMKTRQIAMGTNALASSIVLVCRRRSLVAGEVTRAEFLRELKRVLPGRLQLMIGEGAEAPIAPVDLAQAAIGPGMEVFSKYQAVLEADGSKMPVREALKFINKAIDEFFEQGEGELDQDSRFCLAWFQGKGWAEGAFGEADTLARAKGTSVAGLHEAGVLESGGGKVRLFKPEDYPADWDPTTDKRLPIWEGLHQLIRALRSGGEAESGRLLAKLGDKQESIRALAYRLYTYCERKGWAEDARAYNELMSSWHGVVAAAGSASSSATIQPTLF